MDNSGKLAVDEILSAVGEMTADVKTLGSKTSEVIEHFGVKGMRWGVRRSRKQLARAAKERETSESSESGSNSARASKTRSKKKSRSDLKEMSDAELRQRLNRMNMEKQYRELTSPKANPIKSAGKKMASNVVKGVAEQTLKNLGQSYASEYTKDYMSGGKKAFGKKKD